MFFLLFIGCWSPTEKSFFLGEKDKYAFHSNMRRNEFLAWYPDVAIVKNSEFKINLQTPMFFKPHDRLTDLYEIYQKDPQKDQLTILNHGFTGQAYYTNSLGEVNVNLLMYDMLGAYYFLDEIKKNPQSSHLDSDDIRILSEMVEQNDDAYGFFASNANAISSLKLMIGVDNARQLFQYPPVFYKTTLTTPKQLQLLSYQTYLKSTMYHDTFGSFEYLASENGTYTISTKQPFALRKFKDSFDITVEDVSSITYSQKSWFQTIQNQHFCFQSTTESSFNLILSPTFLDKNKNPMGWKFPKWDMKTTSLEDSTTLSSKDDYTFSIQNNSITENISLEFQAFSSLGKKLDFSVPRDLNLCLSSVDDIQKIDLQIVKVPFKLLTLPLRDLVHSDDEFVDDILSDLSNNPDSYFYSVLWKPIVKDKYILVDTTAQFSCEKCVLTTDAEAYDYEMSTSSLETLITFAKDVPPVFDVSIGSFTQKIDLREFPTFEPTCLHPSCLIDK